jgi:multidrug efflux pump subunit AcrA (membrane-fusion protein)
MSMTLRKSAVAAAGLIAAMAGAAAWAAAGGSKEQDVPTARVQRGRVQVTVHATGDLRATRSALLSVPPVGGTLTIVRLAPSGSAVKAGAIVVEFDPSEQEFALEQATFDLQLAEQEIIKAEAEAAAQAADDEVSLLRARFEVRRGELDAATNELVGAILAEQHRLLLQEARQRLAQLEVDVKSRRDGAAASAAVLRERRMKAQVAVDVARRNIENLQVRAPFDGFVTLRMNMMAFGGVVFSGAVMPEYRLGDTANSGQPVADLIDTTRVEVAAKLPEYDRANVASGQKVQVSVDALPEARLEGAVRSVSGVASRSMFEGGTRRFDIAFDVKGDTSRIRPGVTAALAIEGPAFDDALHIPRSSVFEIGGKPAVFVRTADGFDTQEVRVRALTDTVAVVEGLEAGTEVALVNPNASTGRRTSSSSPARAL